MLINRIFRITRVFATHLYLIDLRVLFFLWGGFLRRDLVAQSKCVLVSFSLIDYFLGSARLTHDSFDQDIFSFFLLIQLRWFFARNGCSRVV